MPTILITGASKGIGKEFATLLANKKNHLILVARDNKLLKQVKQKLQSKTKRITTIKLDLANPLNAKKLYDKTKKYDVDMLINNAGFGLHGEFSKTNLQTEIHMIDLNITTLTILTKLFLKDMIKKDKGKILQVASTASFFAGPLMSVYYATKAYVLSFSLAIAQEIKSKNITITTLCPGPTKSNFQKAANMGNTKLFNKNIPSARQVAKYGLTSLKKGKKLAIYGTKNKFLVFLTRFAPRPLLLKAVYFLQKSKK